MAEISHCQAGYMAMMKRYSRRQYHGARAPPRAIWSSACLNLKKQGTTRASMDFLQYVQYAHQWGYDAVHSRCPLRSELCPCAVLLVGWMEKIGAVPITAEPDDLAREWRETTLKTGVAACAHRLDHEGRVIAPEDE